MKDNKVSLTIRLSPELMAHVKKHGASNYSHFIQELVRKHALDSAVDDDIVARLARQVAKDQYLLNVIQEEVRTLVKAFTNEY